MSGRGSGSCLIRCRGCETKVFILALKKGKVGRERVEVLFHCALLQRFSTVKWWRCTEGRVLRAVMTMEWTGGWIFGEVMVFQVG